jgi:ATP-dependent helicase HrpB
VRLYTRREHDSWPEALAPEVLRLELAEPLLTLHGLGVSDAAGLPWLDPPPAAALTAAAELLARLGAVRGGTLTDVGRDMLRYPLHPRHARVLVEAVRRGAGEAACAPVARVAQLAATFFSAVTLVIAVPVCIRLCRLLSLPARASS